MKKIFALLFAIILLQIQAFAVIVPSGTSVFVQPQKIMDADDVKVGDTVKFNVVKPVKVNNETVIPAGTEVSTKVVKKKNNGILKCEICGFDFAAVYGLEFSEKIHIHHLVEIATIGEEYEVDAVKDLLPVCPNCHMIAHSRKPAYSPEEIKSMINKK